MSDSDFKNKPNKTFTSEEGIYKFWEKLNLFSANPNDDKPPYSLLIPPPNLTGELHLGHAMQHSVLDAVARYKRLCGFDVLLLPGVDHAGIQFEATFNKYLMKKNLSKEKLGREKWLEEAWKFKEDIYKSVSVSWRMLGLSADWPREVFTLDDKPKKAVFEFFNKLWNDGLIYKGPYIVQWCPKCNTAIEDVEMEYEDKKEKLYYIKYKVKESESQRDRDEFIIIATARPETIAADVAVAIYPNHPKYKKYLGKLVVNPFTKTSMPVIADKRVRADFGTGALKITPGHDLLDYGIGKDNNLQILQVINKEGRITDIDPQLAGMKVLEAREKSAEVLKDSIGKIEDYTHSVPVCERCKTVVEPLISEEWFVKMDSMAKRAIKVIKEDQINFLPKNYKKILVDWLKNIHDWCISRSLWWGHRIPVWYKRGVRESKSQRVKDESSNMMVSLESPGKDWVQEEKVLDTWFSSGLWPLSTLGWPEENSKFKVQSSKLMERYFPWDFEISAPEIKYLWIARMIMISVYLTGEIPFKTMFFHGMLRDLQGRKFSKSLGNGIDPTYLINNWGVDATRMALYTYSVPGRDGRVSKGIFDERCKNYRNFATKLRNIARFILELKSEEAVSNSTQSRDDRWITDELKKTTLNVTKYLDSLQLHLACDAIYEFAWHTFADIYIEKTKNRRADAQQTLEDVMKKLLIILHPFMPFVTEEIYQKFTDREKSILMEKWPSLDEVPAK